MEPPAIGVIAIGSSALKFADLPFANGNAITFVLLIVDDIETCRGRIDDFRADNFRVNPSPYVIGIFFLFVDVFRYRV